VVSEEVDVGLPEGAEQGTETEDLGTGAAVASEEAVVAVASEEVGMTLDRREVVAATGAGVAVWATTVEASTTTVHLPAGSALPGLVGLVDLVDQVGMVLTAGGQVMVRLAVDLAAMAVTEDTSSERVQEVSTTGTQSGHDTKSFAIAPHKGMCKWVV